MCEQFVARAAEPFRLDELWPYAERLERFGIAGFGWGATWVVGDGTLRTYRHTAAFRDDPERDRLGAVETTSVLVHLRRPSRLSTLTMPDAQPFDDPAGRFAFSHNGDLRDYKPARARYRAQGRIRGRADSEVGQRWLEDAWSYAGNPENPVFTFRLGRIGLASTAIYSVDRSLFRYAARGATDRALARLHTTITLDERGRPSEAGPGRRPRASGGA